ncbi:MAG: hypothetical protein ACOY9Y_10910 [Bacillota bacterium]
MKGNASFLPKGDGGREVVNMQITGEHRCFVCGHSFSWAATKRTGNIESFSIRANEARGEAIAVGVINTTKGIKVDYEVIASCPRCKNANKIKTTE